MRDMELHQPDEHTNSLAERYCYYSMRAMLSLYMVEELGFSRQTAIAIFSYFSACVYFSPVLGGFVADTYLGKFSTILYFSVVYIAGIIFLTVTSIDALPWGMFTGLGLIALGSGGIKPCVAAFGAEQYARGEFSARDVSRYFMAFYASINVGSILSYIVTPLTRRLAGYPAAFSLSAIFLGLSVIVLILPRKSYVHVPPTGSTMTEVFGAIKIACSLNGGCCATTRLSWKAWRQGCSRRTTAPDGFSKLLETAEAQAAKPRTTASQTPLTGNPNFESSAAVSHAAENRNPEVNSHWMDAARAHYSEPVIHGAKAVLGVTPFFLALPMFWALFDQNGSAFTLQAKNMELYGLQPDNTLILNPALVLVLIPLYEKAIFPALTRCGVHLTALRKIGGGMMLTGLSFVVAALVQASMDAKAQSDDKISVALIIPQYVIITMSEILVSTIGQEWMFTQAPKSMKSTMMSMWFVSVGIGDLLAGVLYSALENLPQQSFYWLFAFLMFLAACIFVLLAFAYVPPVESHKHAMAAEGRQTDSSEDRSQAPVYQGAVLSEAAVSAFSAAAGDDSSVSSEEHQTEASEGPDATGPAPSTRLLQHRV